jgi:hypothetical protein
MLRSLTWCLTLGTAAAAAMGDAGVGAVLAGAAAGGAGWQRDVFASHPRIGLVRGGEGNPVAARAAYRVALGG